MSTAAGTQYSGFLIVNHTLFLTFYVFSFFIISYSDVTPDIIQHHHSNIQDYCKNRNVVIVGLPGAFTPT